MALIVTLAGLPSDLPEDMINNAIAAMSGADAYVLNFPRLAELINSLLDPSWHRNKIATLRLVRHLELRVHLDGFHSDHGGNDLCKSVGDRKIVCSNHASGASKEGNRL